MEEKLRDRKIYKPLETDPTPSIAKKLRSKLKQLKQLNQIDLCTYMTLKPTRAAIPRLFGQPKIHKDGYPLREILNSNGGVTKETDKYISKIIKTYVGDSPYYVKNSAHFVESIKDLKVEEDEILVSFDVTALYPSIPQKKAIELVKDLLMRDENLAKKTKITARNLVELYEICVKQTYFVFNKKLYQQISGLAIGAATSGFAAEIYMCRWETHALETFIRPPKIWRRFVDDTFTNPKKALFQAFDEHLNSQEECIDLTHELETERLLAYMDSNVKRVPDGSLQVSIFRKKTHTDQYLDWSSNHHITQKIGIYSTLKYRCDTLVTTEEDRQVEDEHIKTALRRCGHPEWVFNRKKKDSVLEEVEEEPVIGNGEEVEEVYGSVRIPYVKSLSERLATTYKRYNIKTFHKPTQKLKAIVCNKMKDPVHPLDRPDSIYRYDCSHFEPAYIGETDRQDKVRKYEHGFHPRCEATKVHSLSSEIISNEDLLNISEEEESEQEEGESSQHRRSARQKQKGRVDYKRLHEGSKDSLTDPNSEKSAVKRHTRSVEHEPGDMTCSVLEYEPDWQKRLYKEAIAIRTLKPSLNEDPGKRTIPHIYDNLFQSDAYKKSHPQYSRTDK